MPWRKPSQDGDMFLFFTYILHSFIIRKPHATGKQYTLKGVGGITFGPTSYEIIAEKRV